MELCIAAQPVFSAISVSITNIPTTIDQSQDFGVDVTLNCPSCSSDSYLRAVFYPSGTSYFGFTKNNTGDWINAPGGDCTQYFKLGATDLSKEGTWSGSLRVKVDPVSPYYNSPGDYLFKVGRYTGGCSATWSQESTITVTGPTPTPTQAPTSTPTNTVTPTSTLTLTPTISPTSTPLPTVTSEPISSSTGLLSEGDFFADFGTGASVLGEHNEVYKETPATRSSELNKSLIISTALISLGLAILSGVSVWRLRNASTPGGKRRK